MGASIKTDVSELDATITREPAGKELLEDFQRRTSEGDEEQPVRKYKRRAKIVAAEEQQAIEKAERLKEFTQGFPILCRALVDLTVPSLPNPVPFSDEEVTVFNTALTAVAKKHFDSIANYDAEISLALVLSALFIPRMIKKRNTNGTIHGTDLKKAFEHVPTFEGITAP